MFVYYIYMNSNQRSKRKPDTSSISNSEKKKKKKNNVAASAQSVNKRNRRAKQGTPASSQPKQVTPASQLYLVPTNKSKANTVEPLHVKLSSSIQKILTDCVPVALQQTGDIRGLLSYLCTETIAGNEQIFSDKIPGIPAGNRADAQKIKSFIPVPALKVLAGDNTSTGAKGISGPIQRTLIDELLGPLITARLQGKIIGEVFFKKNDGQCSDNAASAITCNNSKSFTKLNESEILDYMAQHPGNLSDATQLSTGLYKYECNIIWPNAAINNEWSEGKMGTQVAWRKLLSPNCSKDGYYQLVCGGIGLMKKDTVTKTGTISKTLPGTKTTQLKYMKSGSRGGDAIGFPMYFGLGFNHPGNKANFSTAYLKVLQAAFHFVMSNIKDAMGSDLWSLYETSYKENLPAVADTAAHDDFLQNYKGLYNGENESITDPGAKCWTNHEMMIPKADHEENSKQITEERLEGAFKSLTTKLCQNTGLNERQTKMRVVFLELGISVWEMHEGIRENGDGVSPRYIGLYGTTRDFWQDGQSIGGKLTQKFGPVFSKFRENTLKSAYKVYDRLNWDDGGSLSTKFTNFKAEVQKKFADCNEMIWTLIGINPLILHRKDTEYFSAADLTDKKKECQYVALGLRWVFQFITQVFRQGIYDLSRATMRKTRPNLVNSGLACADFKDGGGSELFQKVNRVNVISEDTQAAHFTPDSTLKQRSAGNPPLYKQTITQAMNCSENSRRFNLKDINDLFDGYQVDGDKWPTKQGLLEEIFCAYTGTCCDRIMIKCMLTALLNKADSDSLYAADSEVQTAIGNMKRLLHTIAMVKQDGYALNAVCSGTGIESIEYSVLNKFFAKQVSDSDVLDEDPTSIALSDMLMAGRSSDPDEKFHKMYLIDPTNLVKGKKGTKRKNTDDPDGSADTDLFDEEIIDYVPELSSRYRILEKIGPLMRLLTLMTGMDREILTETSEDDYKLYKSIMGEQQFDSFVDACKKITEMAAQTGSAYKDFHAGLETNKKITMNDFLGHLEPYYKGVEIITTEVIRLKEKKIVQRKDELEEVKKSSAKWIKDVEEKKEKEKAEFFQHLGIKSTDEIKSAITLTEQGSKLANKLLETIKLLSVTQQNVRQLGPGRRTPRPLPPHKGDSSSESDKKEVMNCEAYISAHNGKDLGYLKYYICMLEKISNGIRQKAARMVKEHQGKITAEKAAAAAAAAAAPPPTPPPPNISRHSINLRLSRPELCDILYLCSELIDEKLYKLPGSVFYIEGCDPNACSDIPSPIKKLGVALDKVKKKRDSGDDWLYPLGDDLTHPEASSDDKIFIMSIGGLIFGRKKEKIDGTEEVKIKKVVDAIITKESIKRYLEKRSECDYAGARSFIEKEKERGHSLPPRKQKAYNEYIEKLKTYEPQTFAQAAQDALQFSWPCWQTGRCSDIKFDDVVRAAIVKNNINVRKEAAAAAEAAKPTKLAVLDPVSMTNDQLIALVRQLQEGNSKYTYSAASPAGATASSPNSAMQVSDSAMQVSDSSPNSAIQVSDSSPNNIPVNDSGSKKFNMKNKLKKKTLRDKKKKDKLDKYMKPVKTLKKKMKKKKSTKLDKDVKKPIKTLKKKKKKKGSKKK